MNEDLKEKTVSTIRADYSTIQDIFTLSETLQSLEAWDKMKISAGGVKIRFNRWTFKSRRINQQYVALFNDFGKKLEELSKSHLEQLRALGDD